MTTTLNLMVVAALCALQYPATGAAKTFEGTLVVRYTTDGVPRNMVIRAKGDQTRIDFDVQGRQMGAIYSSKDSTLLLLMLQERMAIDLPAPQVTRYATTPMFVATGQHKDMLGYPADEYICTLDDSVRVRAWMTTHLGGYMMMRNPAASEEQASWEIYAHAHGLFPLEVTESFHGNETLHVEMVSIKNEPPTDESMAIPVGFQKLGRTPGTPAK